MSFSEMVDARHQVIFANFGGIDVSTAVQKELGRPMMFVKRNRVYDVEWDILPFRCEGARGKTRRFQGMPGVMPFEQDDVANEHEELHEVKAKRTPSAPSADGVAAHTVTHEPFRAWVPCLRDRLWLAFQSHRVSGHEYDALAVVGFDSGKT